MSGNRRMATTDEERDVEELLKATEDELLLDLSVGSHIAKVNPSYIDSDLNRRFQALKRNQPSSSSSNPKPPPSEKSIDDASDLLARFAALKRSPHSSSVIGVGENQELGQERNDHQLGGDSDEEDEVDKIIQWAKDAARLDPSPPTSSDDSDNFRPSDVDDSDDDDSEVEEKKQVHKKKPSLKKGLLRIRR